MENQSQSSEQALPQVLINAQYIKDVSFEGPATPQIFGKIKAAPKIDLALDVKVKDLGDIGFEVSLNVNAKALVEDETAFIVELEYAGLFTLKDLHNDEQKEQILLIYCPSLLFPFARRVIADITRDGGYQPLMINPIDFAALYLQQKGKSPQDNN